ncbi:MAG: Phosphate transport system regulatory protein PhoU [uncultured Rubrobacteraceae bacterium]|uniref:Phosphate transport system regulatory protein PhoU n=1 Tax=uncultured Rubrobacteraceae bacterium TaxID=349277 RepID=A0A6J4SEH9_9ACTN|nr:MAG: Phosphate transport system regulatory protein PhoU [uncultured Rubrobacteraceae bacterium]
MPRESFQHELDRLVQEIVSLGREVEGTLDDMANAMDGYDAEVARRDLGVDSRYKGRGAELDEECMILQARQAPVARDLRLIYTIQAVTNHMVRAGTLGEHICRAIVETSECERDPDLHTAILEMGRAARDLFGQGLDVFEHRDIERARDLEAGDDKVDLLYSEAMNLVANPAAGGSGAPEWRARAALMVHYLERIADHGVDIGERTVFLVTGERMESAMRQYRDRDLNVDED